MKKFYLSTDGFISQHKMRKEIAAMGCLYSDQVLIIHTTAGNKHKFHHNNIHIGGHGPKKLVYLNNNEFVLKADLVTPNLPLFKTAEEYLASDMAKADDEL